MTTTIRPSTIPRCAIYARCSGEKQAEKDLSIPAQLDAARATARQRGWEIVAEFVDEAESACTDDRPQFREMIAHARQKPAPFETILVWKFSRFARNREDSVLYKRLLERNGIRVVSLNENVDDSPAGRMLEGILEVVDEFYSQNLAEDTVRGMRKNASMGFRNGGPSPTGYRKVRTGTEICPRIKLDPDPVWAPVVRRMFRLALDGEGACTIAGRLEAEGLKTPRGKVWSKASILQILRNPVYMGVSVWGKQRTGLQKHKPADPVRVEDVNEPLVTPEEFEQVQQRIAARSRARVSPNILRGEYLLSGLLYCATCDQPFIGHPAKGGKHHYYGCQRKMKTGARACNARLLPQARTEQTVVDELRRFVLTPEYITELVLQVNRELQAGSEGVEADLKAVVAQTGEARRKLDRLYEALEDGTLEMSYLAPRIREWKSRVDDLTAKEAELREAQRGAVIHLADEGTIRRYVESLHALLERGTVTQQRTFLRSWVRRIDVTGYELTIHYTLPPLPRGPGKLAKAVGAEGFVDSQGNNDDGAEPVSLEVLPRGNNGSSSPQEFPKKGSVESSILT